MDEVDDYMDVIQMKVEKLVRNLDRIDESGNAAERKKIRETCQRDVEKINNDLRNIQLDIKTVPKDREQEYSDRVASIKAKVIKHQRRLNSVDDNDDGETSQVSKKVVKRKSLVDEGGSRGRNYEDEEKSPEFVKIDVSSAPVEVVGAHALDVQKKSKEALDRINLRLGQAKELAEEEIMELQKQNEKIMKIDTQLNTIEATSARTVKYIRYFGKTLATDRFLLCMIMLILFALVALIIVAVLKKQGS